MASEARYLTQSENYSAYAQRWLANILGVNAWGSSFIVGDGSTFPNCIQHQVANLAGALNGTSGGTPVLWGAASEGPGGYASSGGRWHDSVPGKRTRYIREIQRQQRRVQSIASSGVSG
jgi:endoglucanase